MTPDEFRNDLERATDVISNITGEPITSFRAPSFSITKKSLWALDILAELGYRYDSSIFPVYHDKYGIPNAPRFPHPIETKQGTLIEFPPSVYRLWKWNFPVSGGGYFRLYPMKLSLHCLKQVNRQNNEPFVFYIHPWEVDPEQPRLPGSLRSQFRHYQNLTTTAPKLHRLLQQFDFAPISHVLENRSQMVSNVVV